MNRKKVGLCLARHWRPTAIPGPVNFPAVVAGDTTFEPAAKQEFNAMEAYYASVPVGGLERFPLKPQQRLSYIVSPLELLRILRHGLIR
jgi:hypothetical protein